MSGRWKLMIVKRIDGIWIHNDFEIFYYIIHNTLNRANNRIIYNKMSMHFMYECNNNI